MPKNKDLRDFLKLVKGMGPEYYVELKQPVNPDWELCVIQQKLSARGKFPVIYGQVKGSKLPTVTDLFGSHELLALALGLHDKVKAAKVEEPPFFAFSDNRPQKIDRAKLRAEFQKMVVNKRPVQVVPKSEAPVKEVVWKGDDIDLGKLPITKHGKLDSGKYVTIGCTFSKHPDTGIPNVGVYRMEVKGKDKIGIGTHPAHHIAYIARRHAELGKPMQVAVMLGHHPAVAIGAVAKGSIDLNETEVMGALLGEPLLVTPAETIDMLVPAWAEIIIEGTFDPRNPTIDGPFAEYTGHYGERGHRTVYVLNISAITMRKDAIFHDLDPAHREHNLLPGLFVESAVYDQVKKVVPTVKAVNMPLSGTCNMRTYVSIQKRIQGEGKMAGMAALIADQNSKFAYVVDEDIDVYDEQQVLWAISTRVDAKRDISIIPYVSGPELDPTAYDESGIAHGKMVTKVIIDATKPIGKPFATRLEAHEELWKTMKLSDYVDLSKSK